MNNTPTDSPTFMDHWGQLVWMSLVISVLSAIVWYTTGPLSAFFTAIMLGCMELVMFLSHVLRKHDEEHHPYEQWFVNGENSAGIVAGISIVALMIWVSLISVWTASHNGRNAIGVTLLVIGQACASETIHMIAHHKELGTSTRGTPHRDLLKLVGLLTILAHSVVIAWNLLK